VQLETRSPGASVTRRTCEDCRFGRSFDTYALHFLRQPGGGDLAVEVDGQIHRRASTDGPTGLGVLQGRVPPGDHELRVVSQGGGSVALLGLRTLSGDRGVEYSSLGLNGATAPDFAEMHGAVTAAELGQLDPDLLVFAFGTNGAYNLYRFARKYADNPKAIAQQEHRWARGYRRLLSLTLEATDGASCLVVTPPDLEAGACRWRSSTPGRCTRRPAVFDRVVAHQTRIARQFGCAVWRQSEAMGGPGSIRRWHNRQPTLAQKDGKHLTIEGYRAVGDQLYDDLMGAYESWQRGEPTPLKTGTIR
jgi:lysophospholipase L1-like esterase